MTSEFVPYALALRMKALGFDEPCMASRDMGNGNGLIQIPIYQQAFRWFREKYELYSCIHSDYTWNISGGIWDLNEYKGSRYDWDSEPYSTYEEAELDCLTKLIEIIESKTK